MALPLLAAVSVVATPARAKTVSLNVRVYCGMHEAGLDFPRSRGHSDYADRFLRP